MKRGYLVGLIALTACGPDLEYVGAFSVPQASVMLPISDQGPFSEAVAYVGNANGGQIRPLAAESGRFLSDGSIASFLRGPGLPTGSSRVISALAVHQPGDGMVTVYAVDQSTGHLLEVPHIVGVTAENEMIKPELTVSEPTGAGIESLNVHQGFAATETWTLTWDGERWWPNGTVSGNSHPPIFAGTPYTIPSQAFTVTMEAGQAPGDTAQFSVESGLLDYEFDGVVVDVVSDPAAEVIALMLQSEQDQSKRISWWNPATKTEVGTLELDVDAQVTSAVADSEGLWVAQALSTGEGVLWRVPYGDTIGVRYEVPIVPGLMATTHTKQRLYFAESGSDRLFAWDIPKESLVDLAPWEQDSSGFAVGSLIRGLAEIPGTVTQLDDDDDLELRTTTDPVALSLFRDTVVVFDPEVGCLLQDGLGPRTTSINTVSAAAGGDYNQDFAGAGNGPRLTTNRSNGNHVVVNACAGVARAQQWTVTFDGDALNWIVEGELSGEQMGRAFEGQRYRSDSGEVSFTISPGINPTRDGWEMTFNVVDGILGLSGDQDDDGVIDLNANEFSWSLPGRPLPVLLPPLGDRTEAIPAVIVPLQGGDRVVRGRIDTGLTDAVWE